MDEEYRVALRTAKRCFRITQMYFWSIFLVCLAITMVAWTIRNIIYMFTH